MVETFTRKHISVILADDHPMIRMGIRSLLAKHSDIKVVGEAENGQQALDLVLALQPDVLLLDVEMPLLKGYEVAKMLREREAKVKIIVLSTYKDSQYILQMLASGADVYISKEEAPDLVVRTIRRLAVMAGAEAVVRD